MNASEKKIYDGSRAHIRYRLKDNTIVPGVTTFIGQLDKPAMTEKANQLGLQGIVSRTYWKSLANIGSLVHLMILADLSGGDPEACTTEAERPIIDLAENSFLSYLNWKKGKRLTPILLEKPIVSEVFKFGGTLDYYGGVDDELTLADFKTGAGIYYESWYQLASLAVLLAEAGYKAPQKFTVINIPRAETDAFDVKSRGGLSVEWQIAKRLLEIYHLKKELTK
jgi:hypothetical protein